MKRLVIVSLSALALSLVAGDAFANEISAIERNVTRSIVEITPFNLVTSSYQGYFADRGIPSNAAFLTAVSRGKVTAKDLVEKAIAKGRLAPDTINDRAYLRNVSSHLSNLNND